MQHFDNLLIDKRVSRMMGEKQDRVGIVPNIKVFAVTRYPFANTDLLKIVR